MIRWALLCAGGEQLRCGRALALEIFPKADGIEVGMLNGRIDVFGNAVRKTAIALLAAVVAFSLTPIGSAYAVSELTAASFAPTAASGTDSADFTPTSNKWKHDYTVYTQPTTSYLHVTPQDSLERVEYIDSNIIVETISPDLKSVLSSKTIPTETFTPTGATRVLFGTFFSGSDCNYIVTGQPNYSESDDVAVYRVTKYSKSWQYISHVELKGANTYLPFYVGSCDCSENEGTLVVRTCHQMYGADEGERHQANLTFEIDKSSMKITRYFYYGGSTNNYFGYVSHSLNQFTTYFNGDFYGIDHGDGAPRGIVAKKFGSNTYKTFYTSSGNIGYNYTAMALGGVETSSSTNKILVAGNSVDQSLFTMTNEASLARNIWIADLDADLNNSNIHQLTSYADGQGATNATNPFIVKANDNRFLVLWSVAEGTQYKPTLEYCFVDGDGNRLCDNIKTEGQLSDCQPVVYNGKAIWYVGNNAAPTFYSIDLSIGNMAITATLASATFTVDNVSTIYHDGHYQPMSIYYGDFRKGLTSSGTAADGLVTLVENRDYKMTYETDFENRTCNVHFTGIGPYDGRSSDMTLHIIPESMQQVTASDLTKFEYTGSPIVPHVVLTNKAGEQLVEGTDYTVSTPVEAIEPGYYSVVFTGMGFYDGRLYKRFWITQQDFTNTAKVTFSPEHLVYTGSDLAPTVSVTVNGKQLVKGVDFSLDFTPKKEVGQNTIRINGIGNYCGIIDKTYTIKPRSIASAVVTAYGTWDDITAKVVLDGKRLESDKDYTFAVDKTSDEAVVTVTGIGNYEGTATCAVTPSTLKLRSLQAATVTLPYSRYSYTSLPITPSPTVKLNGETLVKDADYRVSYNSNVEAGLAKVTVTGINGYSDSAFATFYIYRQGTFSGAVVELPESTYAYTGSQITPEPTVRFEGGIKVKGVDYTVSYLDNIDTGVARVVVTGINGCDGTAMQTFVIEKESLATATVKLPKASYAYTAAQIKPVPTVMLGGKTLAAGTDYTVSYANNIAVGRATVTITGNGLYEGQAAARFKIAYTSAHKANPMKATAKKRTFTTTAAKTKVAKVRFAKKKVFRVSGAKGKVTFAKKSGSRKLKITRAGAVVLKKGTKKGTYSMKVKVTAAGNAKYKLATKTVSVRVRVK